MNLQHAKDLLTKRARNVQRRAFRLYKLNPRLILCVIMAIIGLLQFVMVYLYLGPSSPSSAPKKPGGDLMSKSLGNEKVVVRDLWQKYFSRTDSVPWPEFAAHLLVNNAQGVQELPELIFDELGGKFDLNGDGKVTRKEFQRCMLRNGEVGVQQALEAVVNDTLSRAAQRRDALQNPIESSGCALGMHGGHHNYMEVPLSADLQFAGETEFCIEAWISPNVTSEQHRTYGGTLVSKYNRGRMGQFFMSLEHSGDVFFHRETPPWGLRSTGVHVPPGVFTHVAFSYGAGRSKLFINGTLRASQLEGGMAADAETPLLVGAIYDNGQPTSGFHGLLDEVRIWNIDRTQVEIQSSMHSMLTGVEVGLMAYWGFDECAGGRARDKMGRHDALLHGGRWHSSHVKLLDAANLAAEAEKTSQKEMQDMVVVNDKLNFNYWKRSINILEEQVRINRLVLKRKAEYSDLVKRVKVLEKNEAKQGKMVLTINQRNVNTTQVISDMTTNLTLHENATGIFGAEYEGGWDMDSAFMDEGLSVRTWLDGIAQDVPGLTEDVWRSFEEDEEARLELEEGVSMNIASPEQQATIKSKHRKKIELLPAIELAVKSGFAAEENALNVLEKYNSGTFNMDQDIAAEDEDEEYVNLLKLKGYSPKKIKAMLQRRKEAEGDDISKLSIGELLQRKDLTDMILNRKAVPTKKSKKAATSKSSKRRSNVEGEDNKNEHRTVGTGVKREGMRRRRKTPEEEMLEEDQDYDFEAQYGLETTDYDEDSRPSKHQSKASTDAKGSRKSHNSNMLADDASRKKQSHLKPAVMPEEDDEEDEEEMPRKRTRPRSSRLTPRSKFLDEGVESDQESADDLMVNTLVSGLVPRVEELLKGDDPDDVMPMQGEEEDEGQADDEDHPEREDDFGERDKMPEDLKLRLEQGVGELVSKNERPTKTARAKRKQGMAHARSVPVNGTVLIEEDAEGDGEKGSEEDKVSRLSNGFGSKRKKPSLVVEGVQVPYTKPKQQKLKPELWTTQKGEHQE